MIEVEHLYANASIGSNVKVLQDILLESKNIVIHHRDTTMLQKEIDALVDPSFECRASGSVVEIEKELINYFNDNFPTVNLLLKDIRYLLNEFQNVTSAPSYRILLATVSSNMCKKFHTDINRLRMLCTYCGPGTMWLPDEHVSQNVLRSTHSNQDEITDEVHIQQVQTGDVIILKGALFPDADPILHRSPSIEESGLKRLLLRIDINESIWT